MDLKFAILLRDAVGPGRDLRNPMNNRRVSTSSGFKRSYFLLGMIPSRGAPNPEAGRGVPDDEPNFVLGLKGGGRGGHVRVLRVLEGSTSVTS